MSVHRAGSFYGVPHSTLEYKVKERNLMRNKKRTMSIDDNMSEFDGSENGNYILYWNIQTQNLNQEFDKEPFSHCLGF